MALALPLRLTSATLLLAALTFIPCAQAGNWRFEPAFSQGGSWESNALMRTRNPVELYGSITSVSLNALSQTPTAEVSFANTVKQNLFNEATYNSTDFHNQTQLLKRCTQWEALLGASGDYDTTRTSEITSLGTNTKAVRHWGLSVSPELSFIANATNKISVSTSAAVSRYDDKVYTNYNLYAAATTWTHAFTADTSGLFALNARRYQTQNNIDETVDSLGPNFGLNITLTPRLTTRLMAGLEASKQDRTGSPNASWEWSSVYSAALNYKGAQDTLSLGSKRAQQPYSNGTSSLLTSVYVQENHALSKLFSLVIGGDYARAEQSGIITTSTLENKIGGKAGLVYHAFEDIDVDATYRYREESYRGTSNKAKDNAAMVTISYRPLISGAP
ncbi:MAG: hypothetical protein WC612_08265 [Bdellovibrionales bacterium]|jgi:hypothetical protein